MFSSVKLPQRLHFFGASFPSLLGCFSLVKSCGSQTTSLFFSSPESMVKADFTGSIWWWRMMVVSGSHILRIQWYNIDVFFFKYYILLLWSYIVWLLYGGRYVCFPLSMLFHHDHPSYYFWLEQKKALLLHFFLCLPFLLESSIGIFFIINNDGWEKKEERRTENIYV